MCLQPNLEYKGAKCPNCGNPSLEVYQVNYGTPDSEVWTQCNRCQHSYSYKSTQEPSK